ncbi:GDSL-type esterase/lipase family protein [Cohnella sp. WQ 127256]|uniref:SGNH/GDSL hydrolase family protein n=1 Tax=Cohnella sp. WQ 127256 TaxID=2938790 RepID=UPI002117F58C|nr:GDSL-type esterase/lipase family protein [Cohnella sp. WQ 127256]
MLNNRQLAESFVFMREEALPLRYKPITEQPVALRNCSRSDHPERIDYVEGKDYIIDYEQGTIRRSEDSRIPDGALHPMYGVIGFDHNLYPDYSNQTYTVYVDYSTESETSGKSLTAVDIEQSGLLNHVVGKLKAGEEIVYVVYGDSISTGGEASEESLTYFGRFADTLRSLYPQAQIRIVNKSIGGEDTSGGMSRVDEDVVPLHPAVVSIGYGMNDQNKQEQGNTTSLEDFEKNLRFMIDAIRKADDTDIILVTPCEPNPDWQHTSGQTSMYADVIRQLGSEYGIGVADAHAEWVTELAAGKTPESLLLNNINHPNDYGHWIYSKAFAPMLKK